MDSELAKILLDPVDSFQQRLMYAFLKRKGLMEEFHDFFDEWIVATKYPNPEPILIPEEILRKLDNLR
ncbi:MAG: hypothetical protein L6Q54_12465 [Leptospiraceae bacterium]|nr:hypothetical protein [Leptospiraceae bacterium]MCK6382046.1 hypothetical protein [Leptospiraceae bacterium]NUM42958.1 hypothetical protein [Leptospiraceae bacterium]